MKDSEQYFFKIANLNIQIENTYDDLLLDQNSGSRHFFCNNNTDAQGYRATVTICQRKDFPSGCILYTGIPWGDLQMPYRWSVSRINECWAVDVDYEGHESFRSAMAVINQEKKEIYYYFDVIELPVLVDPFLYPLGILVFIYLALFNRGLVIHASGVADNGKGYLFTGLSGIGKSTMARLWAEKGATIINDDRLAIMPDVHGFSIHNTPMPYYQDYPQSCRLNGIFLLKQSSENYCQLMNGASAMVRVMANCMQHFHSQQFIQMHLSIVESITHRIPVFELGFKPDGDIVELIRNLKL